MKGSGRERRIGKAGCGGGEMEEGLMQGRDSTEAEGKVFVWRRE